MNIIYKSFALILGFISINHGSSTNMPIPGFLDLSGKSSATKTYGMMNFGVFNGNSYKSYYMHAADIAYEQTFRRVFIWEDGANQISGEDRLLSLLNSLLFPAAGEFDFKIRKVELLPNEVTKMDERTLAGVLKFDVACKCTCHDGVNRESVKVLDVEMQNAYNEQFVYRLFDYGSVLRSRTSKSHAIVLSFLNHKCSKTDEQNDKSAWTALFYRDLLTGEPTRPVDNFIDTHVIDLSQKVVLLNRNEPIYFAGNELGREGREWLKLFSMRHWAAMDGSRCYFPSKMDICPAVRSAISVLSAVDDFDLLRYSSNAEYVESLFDQYLQKGIKQGIEEGIKQGIKQSIEEGIEEGKKKQSIQTLLNLMQNGLPMDMLVAISQIPTEAIDFIKILSKRVQEYIKACNEEGVEPTFEEFSYIIFPEEEDSECNISVEQMTAFAEFIGAIATSS